MIHAMMTGTEIEIIRVAVDEMMMMMIGTTTTIDGVHAAEIKETPT
jgi:hypothetical protein